MFSQGVCINEFHKDGMASLIYGSWNREVMFVKYLLLRGEPSSMLSKM